MSKSQFDREGFTGASRESLKQSQRARFTDLFDLADNCSSLGMRTIHLFPPELNKRKLVMKLYLHRVISHYQAAMTLAESGMNVESLVLTRGLFETAFVMLAIAEDAVTLGELVDTDYANRSKQVNAILNGAKNYPSVAPYSDKLSAFSEKYKNAEPIDIREFARRGGALPAYDGIYRNLSHYAAHPSLSAVDVYLTDRENGRLSVDYRATTELTPRSVVAACTGTIFGISACEKIGVVTDESNSTCAALFAQLEQLDAQYNPWR